MICSRNGSAWQLADTLVMEVHNCQVDLNRSPQGLNSSRRYGMLFSIWFILWPNSVHPRPTSGTQKPPCLQLSVAVCLAPLQLKPINHVTIELFT